MYHERWYSSDKNSFIHVNAFFPAVSDTEAKFPAQVIILSVDYG